MIFTLWQLATETSSVMVARAAQWNPSLFRKEGVLPPLEIVRDFVKIVCVRPPVTECITHFGTAESHLRHSDFTVFSLCPLGPRYRVCAFLWKGVSVLTHRQLGAIFFLAWSHLLTQNQRCGRWQGHVQKCYRNANSPFETFHHESYLTHILEMNLFKATIHWHADVLWTQAVEFDNPWENTKWNISHLVQGGPAVEAMLQCQDYTAARYVWRMKTFLAQCQRAEVLRVCVW